MIPMLHHGTVGHCKYLSHCYLQLSLRLQELANHDKITEAQ